MKSLRKLPTSLRALFLMSTFLVAAYLPLSADAAATMVSIKVPDGLFGVSLKTLNNADGSMQISGISFGYRTIYIPLYGDDGGVTAATGFCAAMGKVLVTRPTLTRVAAKTTALGLAATGGSYVVTAASYYIVNSITCR